MYEGYLQLGDAELINSARAAGYAATSSCAVSWLQGTVCPGLQVAVDPGVPYSYTNIAEAPWYDAQHEPSHHFLGVSGVIMENLPGSTREAGVTEGVMDGGAVGRVRNATRRMRVEAMLTAEGEDALETGFAWLDATLRAGGCAQNHNHRASCSGHADLKFFIACIPEAPTALEVEGLTRYVHTVTCVSGPTVVEKMHRGDAWGYLVEFVLVSAVPWLHGVTASVATSPTIPVVVQDVPFNLVPYPSAELSSGTVVAATNYSSNPSVELDATGWAASSTVVVAGNVTGARSTDLASVGAASFRSRFVATNTATAGTVAVENTSATFTATVAGARMSVNMWASAVIESGTAVIGSVDVQAVWRAGTTVLRTDTVGTVPTAGGAVTSKSIAVPVGATNVIMRGRANLTSWSTGAVVNVYGDAVAVTVP